jgi:hypothetical protein
MIDHLAEILDTFPGSANRTRCFTHILNLVAKCIMRQFDSPKAKASDFEAALEGLADDLENCDGGEGEDENKLDDLDDDEDDDEITSGREGMGEEEIEMLEESVKPVKQVLLKVLFIPWQQRVNVSHTYLTIIKGSKSCSRYQELDDSYSPRMV